MLLTQLIENVGLVPTISSDGLDALIEGGKALARSEIDVFEVDAENISPKNLGLLCAAVSGTEIGISNIKDIIQAKAYTKAGARYVTVFDADEGFMDQCRKNNIDFIPVCRREAELERYINFGVLLVRCECSRITDTQRFDKIAAGQDVKLIVASVEEPPKLKRYARNPGIVAMAGPWICPGKWINSGHYDKVAEKAADIVRDMLGFKIAHVGINAPDESEASSIACGFSDILGMPATDFLTSFFVSSLIEVNKEPGRGAHGHIGIYTNNINRAVHHIEKRGFKIDTAPLAEGRPGPLYLHTEVGGFAVHLIQND